MCIRDRSRDKNQANRFVGRQWIVERFGDIQKAEIVIYKDSEIIRQFLLKVEHRDNKDILTHSEDTSGVYTWGTLTPGYADTVGFTAGIMVNKGGAKTLEQLTLPIDAKPAPEAWGAR